MAAPLCTLLFLQANINLFWKPMIEMRSKGLRVCHFICAVMRFVILTMYLEVVLSSFVDVSTKRKGR